MEPARKQVDYLASLIGVSRDWEIERYVGDVVGKSRTKVRPQPLTRTDYSRAIDAALAAQGKSSRSQADRHVLHDAW